MLLGNWQGAARYTTTLAVKLGVAPVANALVGSELRAVTIYDAHATSRDALVPLTTARTMSYSVIGVANEFLPPYEFLLVTEVARS